MYPKWGFSIQIIMELIISILIDFQQLSILSCFEHPSDGVILSGFEHPSDGVILSGFEHPSDGVILSDFEQPSDGVILIAEWFRASLRWN